MNLTEQPITSSDKESIAAAFSKAAPSYDRHAHFQRQVVHRLLAQLPEDLFGCKVLDVGCGTGYFSKHLIARGAKVVCLDLSKKMLEQARFRCGDAAQYCLADAEAIPYSEGEFDYVVSSLALQWCADLTLPLAELHRVCKVGGQVVWSTLADGSLSELKDAWHQVDDHQHVKTFLSEKQIKIALAQTGGESYQVNFLNIIVWYSNALGLMKDLKGIGATSLDSRASGLTKRSALVKVDKAYKTFFTINQLLPATYRVCLGIISK